VDNLTPTALSYSGVTPGTVIITTKHVCLVTKNKLLVHGLSSTSENIFELQQLVNNSPTSISSVTLLATETSSKTYIMQSCDFSGGAWFRTTNEEEEHAFYDPDTNQLYKNNGNIATRKLISVANSRRGHYFTFFWDTSNN
jgi:hypothetical protein